MKVQFDTNKSISYWLQERLIFFAQARDEYETVKVWTNLHGSESNPLAVYNSAAVGTGDVYDNVVDMTDYVRAYRNVTHIYFKQDSESMVDITISVAGLINPAGVYIPPFTMPDALIVPPERILYAGLTDIRCEFYPAVTTGLTWALSGGAIWAVNKRWIDAIGDFVIYRLKSGQTTIERKSTFQAITIDACKSPAVAVRWVSFTGVQRVHHFMLRKPTIASAENYQLLTLDNSYNEIKGRVDGLDLYLDDLLPYDLWYYADVITSSKVEVSLDGQTWNQVQVTNKNVTIPTGEMGNGKLEITVNWRKYDAVTM
jgi:hypothetical protein